MTITIDENAIEISDEMVKEVIHRLMQEAVYKRLGQVLNQVDPEEVKHKLAGLYAIEILNAMSDSYVPPVTEPTATEKKED